MIHVNKSPPLRLLRAFCLAARHASFKSAADRLSITPSAVSHQVKELEEQLEVTLFERRSRSVVLTSEGRQLFGDLEPVLEALDAAIARTARATGSRKQLTVVLPPFFATELFAPRLSEFHSRHPDIDLQVDTHDPRPMAHPSYSDLSVVLASQPPPDPDVQSVRLLPLNLVAAASADVAEAVTRKAADRSTGHAFDDQTLIMHRSFRIDGWDRWLAQVGVDLRRLRNVVEFDNMGAVARAAGQGAGIALVPAIVCRPWFDSGALTRIDGYDYPGNEAYYLVSRRADSLRPEVHAFTDWMTAEFRLPEKSENWDDERSVIG